MWPIFHQAKKRRREIWLIQWNIARDDLSMPVLAHVETKHQFQMWPTHRERKGWGKGHHITRTRQATSELISRDSALCPTAVQKQEVTTTTSLIKTQGVLSMDAPTQAPSVKTRLGNKVQTAPASSTTSGFGPSTKTSAGRNWQSVNDTIGYLKQWAVFSRQSLFMTVYPCHKTGILSGDLHWRCGISSFRLAVCGVALICCHVWLWFIHPCSERYWPSPGTTKQFMQRLAIEIPDTLKRTH